MIPRRNQRPCVGKGMLLHSPALVTISECMITKLNSTSNSLAYGMGDVVSPGR